MKQTNNNKSKLIKFLNGKAFYVVVCFCLVIVGVAAWSGMQLLTDGEDKAAESASNASSSASLTAENVASKPLFSSQDSKPDSTASSNLNVSSKNEDSSEVVSEGDTASDTEGDHSEQTAAPVANFFINPVLGEIIKNFSDTELQYSMTMKDMRLHKGIDIAADEGTPVIAAGEGTVTNVYEDMLLGWVVEIDHGNLITAKYCGLSSKPSAKVGDTVNSSTRIGNVGTVPFESVEQNHLHLEFFLDGNPVPPTEYIGQ